MSFLGKSSSDDMALDVLRRRRGLRDHVGLRLPEVGLNHHAFPLPQNVPEQAEQARWSEPGPCCCVSLTGKRHSPTSAQSQPNTETHFHI